MNNKTAEHNPGASDSARLFNSYFPSLFKTPPVQRAACALLFEGSPQESIYPKGAPSKTIAETPRYHQFSQIIIREN